MCYLGLPTESSEVARRLFSEDVVEDGHDELIGLVDEGIEFREKPSRAAGCITSLKFAFERAVRSTEFMDHKSIKRLLNGFANYAHQSQSILECWWSRVKLMLILLEKVGY
jgi:hypothetical protein